MKKHGWTEGKGLGKNEHGMSEPIKVKLKKDTSGVGHDPSEHFTYHWWDDAFKNATNNINIEESESGIIVTAKETSKTTTTRKLCKKTRANKSMLYGRFVKSGTITAGVEEHEEQEEWEEQEEEGGGGATLTDEQLFKACGGRTAHKGARHGLKLSGKLARLAEQEGNTPEFKVEESCDLKTKKKKKGKKKKTTDCSPDSGIVLSGECGMALEEPTDKPGEYGIIAEEHGNDDKTNSSKKKKRKRKRKANDVIKTVD
uniref:G patch domain-containing protein 4 n=1 Tax=Ciona savignyi TaxID=51511 RepID=H2YJL4_CIOSA